MISPSIRTRHALIAQTTETELESQNSLRRVIVIESLLC
jgi:hypothetical protein